MQRLAIGLCLALGVSGAVFAHGGIDAARNALQASLVVTGEIAINPDGTVYGYSLDHRDKLPPEIEKLVAATIPQWKFAPVTVAGKAARISTDMSLRIVASQSTPGHFQATVKSAAFGGVGRPGTTASVGAGAVEGLTYASRKPPAYPPGMIREGVSGTVYVVARVNRAGTVDDAVARQVDLRKLGDGTELRNWRDALASATLAAVRTWTFHVPTDGVDALRPAWTVTLPVDFSLVQAGQELPPEYQWDAYVPGPVNPVPWPVPREDDAIFLTAGDAIPSNGGPFVPDRHFILQTAADGTPIKAAGAAATQN